MMGFWDAVASAGPYAGQAAPRCREITTPTPHHSIFTGQMLFLTPNQQCQSTEGSAASVTIGHILMQKQCLQGWLGSRLVSVLDSGTVVLGFKSQSRCCPVAVLGKLFTPIVPLFINQQNW